MTYIDWLFILGWSLINIGAIICVVRFIRFARRYGTGVIVDGQFLLFAFIAAICYSLRLGPEIDGWRLHKIVIATVHLAYVLYRLNVASSAMVRQSTLSQ